MKKIYIGLLLCCLSLLSWAGDTSSAIEGIWKHSEKDAWIEFHFNQGVGKAFVAEHRVNPSANGLIVLQNIKTDSSNENTWEGEMYAAHINGFLPATLTLQSDNSLEILITNDTEIEVLRLLRD